MVDDLEKNQQREYEIESKKNGYIKEVVGRSITTEEERQESMEGMKKSEMKEFPCRYCGEILDTIFERRAHEMWCEKNPNGRRRNIPASQKKVESLYGRVIEFLNNHPNTSSKDLMKQFPEDKKGTITRYKSKWNIKRKSLENGGNKEIDLEPQEDFVPSEELKTYQEFIEYKKFKKMKKELKNQ